MLGAAIKKDLWLLLADRGRLALLFGMPLIFIAVFGAIFTFGPDAGEKEVVAIAYARGDAGPRIEAALALSGHFEPHVLDGADDVREAVRLETVRIGLVIPAEVSDRDGHRVELVMDDSAPLQLRGPLEAAIASVIARALDPRAASPPRLVDVRAPPGSKPPGDVVSGFQAAVPGNAVLFGFFMAMTVAMSFAHERQSGTWRRLVAAPVSRTKLMLAKLVPFYLAGVLQLALIFAVGALVFGMTIASSVILLALVTLMVAACTTSFGLLVASFGWNERQLGSGVPVIALVMGLLGGCMVPRFVMPAFMRDAGRVVPQSWSIDAYYDVIVRPDTTLADIAPQLGALALFTIAFAAIGARRFRFE